MKSFEDRALFESIVDRVRRVQSRSPRQWGRMTPHQMLCHCSDFIRFGLNERPVSPATSFLNRHLVKYLALYTPIPWPKGVPTRPEADQEMNGTPPVEFERDREETIRLLHRFVSERPSSRPPHPIFGPLTEFEWMRLAYLHMDHHLRQFSA